VLDGPPRDGLLRTPPGTLPEIALDEYRSLVRIAGIEAFRAAWLRHPLMQLQTSDPRMHELLAAIVARYAGRDLLGEGTLPAPGGQASIVTVPLLVINGELDTLQRRATGELLAHAMPQAQRVLVPRAGHLPNLDNPTGYHRALDEFLERHLFTSPSNSHHRSTSNAAEQSRRHRR
jgi:pimeloyl-ACP methyl ester carboxylesterase